MKLPALLFLSVFAALVSHPFRGEASPGMGAGADALNHPRVLTEEKAPDIFAKAIISENLGRMLSPDIPLVDEDGKNVTLGTYLNQGKPVLLNFAYFGCPMLCNLVVNGMLEGLKQTDWTPGKEFTLLTISIDSTEGPELAAAKKKTLVDSLGKPEAARGWHLLTGKGADIRRLADEAGFGYAYNPDRGDYAHQAGLIIASPAGKLCRYLYGITYKGRDLRLGLLDAMEGKALAFSDRVVMFCFRYDEKERKYVLFARNFMTAGGVVVLAGLGGLLIPLWVREGRRRREGKRA